MISGIARNRHIHRRDVRQALKNSKPPPRKRSVREAPVLRAFKGIIDQWLLEDKKKPRKQCHYQVNQHFK